MRFKGVSIVIALVMLLVLPVTAKAVTIFLFADLTGAQETPPNPSTALGVGAFVFDTDTSILTGLVAHNVTNTTAAHIHMAPAGVAGGIVFPMPGSLPTPSPIFVTWLVPANLVTPLLNGGLYFNIHSSMFPGGEIRGQLLQIPEPATMALVGTGLLGLALRKRRAA